MSPPAPSYNADANTIGQPIRVTFPFSNHGREPAIDVTVTIHFDTISRPQDGDIATTEKIADNVCDKGLPPIVQSSVAAPGPGSLLEIVHTNIHGSNVVWDDALNTQHNILRAKGCVSYITFGVRRYTWFCRLFVLVSDQQSRRGALGSGCNGGDGAT
jgi:hypothetical protein